MPVSGIVVRCVPAKTDSIKDQLAQFQGIEVHGALPDGRIIAVLEADSVDAEIDLVSEIEKLAGVVSVQLAYHNFEDL